MIAIYGATGAIGRWIAQTLAPTGPLRLVARNPDRLRDTADAVGGAAEVRVADTDDPIALRNALADAEIIINCAGPYLGCGEAIVDAAVALGSRYVDICAEQRFARQVYERYESRARKSGSIVLCGMGVTAALGDWASALIAKRLGAAKEDGQPLDDLRIGYAFDQVVPSSGLRQSFLAQLAEPPAQWVLDRWESEPANQACHRLSFPEPFGVLDAIAIPSSEVICVPRHVRSHRIATYLALPRGVAASRFWSRTAGLLSTALPALIRSPLGEIARSTRFPIFPSEGERSQSSFAIVAAGIRGSEQARIAITGRDPYAVTVDLCARAAMELPRCGIAGVVTPAETFSADEWLRQLTRAGIVEVFES